MSFVVAVLPAYNEEIAIGSVVLRTEECVDEVIVIDDGSTDKTVQIAEAAGARVISHDDNMGKGAALKTGFNIESKNGADIIVTLDSDGQHNPDEIPHLIAPILAGEADIVNGSRYINGNGKNTPAYRRIGQRILDCATNVNTGQSITDTQSGFRAFAAHTLPVFRFKSNGLAIESEMLADAAKAGLRVKEVEIGVRYDVDCSTENPVSHGVGVLNTVIWLIAEKRPLLYIGGPGFIMSLAGVFFGIRLLQLYNQTRYFSLAYAMLVAIFLILGALGLFMGLMLNAISRLRGGEGGRG
ncbi:MAG: glycosyltransferase family 2 protein [Euryarchaeota archaeon]|nr:glycosyltransferase family 2 protein [Euryarchaeota archaeon]